MSLSNQTLAFLQEKKAPKDIEQATITSSFLNWKKNSTTIAIFVAHEDMNSLKQ